ncbi:hypothetical protein LAZ67_23000575 [Cordylochernes scorpioides]|uniref:Uncharacterized protein n=1 Tax=Cordylochernes scorpioides TaxID=51811 RepID=A0ABY6LT67_9ARAC|nr:hypothetical protein LAZ67_23000575 [Cordylochernes scorpioides]
MFVIALRKIYRINHYEFSHQLWHFERDTLMDKIKKKCKVFDMAGCLFYEGERDNFAHTWLYRVSSIKLVEVYGEKCMDIKNMRKWCREFNEGRINVHDEQRSGRPSLPESTVNRRITLEEIEDGLNEDCSHFSVHKIVSETLGYRKVSARWVDKWLKEAAGECYSTGITKLVDRIKKVIEHQGDYVEE